jgi:ABC-type transport system involved in multi-copper enzyme maturation permease subunit
MSASSPPAVSARFPRHLVPVFAWGFVHVVRWPKVALVAVVAMGAGYVLGHEAVSGPDPLAALTEVIDRAALPLALPLITLLLAADGFAWEVQERTLVYHLVRPVSRTTVFLARFLSGLLPALAVGVLFLAVLLATSPVPAPRGLWGAVPATVGLGVLAFAAVYYVLGALLRHGLVVGLVYTFVVEVMLTSVAGTMQKLSVSFHVQSLWHRLVDADYEALVPKPLVRIVTEPPADNSLLGGLTQVTPDSVPQAVTTLLVVTIAALCVGAWLLRRKDFALKD